ncbi:MAG: family 20 glycosylhydrolase [Flammeovirgaceae bacterium]
MKWFYQLTCFLACLLFSFSCQENIQYQQKDALLLIPQPQKLQVHDGYFKLAAPSSIYADHPFQAEAQYLKKIVEASSSFDLKQSDSPDSEYAILLLQKEGLNHAEAYELAITAAKIELSASAPEGMMRGIQTLRQLFMPAFQGTEKRAAWYLPQVEIVDAPKFEHRGLLLDCARHFFDKEVVKQYVDLLAFHKMNVLHWHITEDQGWRIKIDKYPKLTSVGAWRTEKTGERYGGFYTKADIKEIVAYAAERHIDVIPEIELPGHSQAAIAAYPHLSCTGEQVEVVNDWGVFKEIYCAGNDSTFEFLEDVLTEVMELFPSKYIHIGGDETPKYRWENCSKCQLRMKNEGLHDEHELQSYFIGRIEQFLKRHGRVLVGWDEILEGGLSTTAVVQSWRGNKGGIAAAKAGNQVIMSPNTHCYLDYGLQAIDLETVYHFDPIPSELAPSQASLILGGECNMWTEYVPDKSTLDSKVFPRMLAMAEVLWRYPEQRDYEAFYNRVQQFYPVLTQMGIKYGQENLPATIELNIADEAIGIKGIPGNKDISLNYKWNCDTCSMTSHQPLPKVLPLAQSGELSIQAVKYGQTYGALVLQPFEFHEALGKPVTYQATFSDFYTAGGKQGLVNGRVGTLDFRDGNWQGFFGKDMSIVIDLGKEKDINYLNSNYYQYNNSWIFFPVAVHYEISTDGKNYTKLGTLKPKEKPKTRGKFIESFPLNFDSATARYVKVTAQSIMTVPDWHEAAGSHAWIFVDEIVVR